MNMNWINEKIKRINYWDLKVIKISMMAFTLLIAKLWSPILSLEWYWYAIVFAVTYVYLFIRIFGK